MTTKAKIYLFITFLMLAVMTWGFFTGRPAVFFGFWIPAHIPAALAGWHIGDSFF